MGKDMLSGMDLVPWLYNLAVLCTSQQFESSNEVANDS